MPARKATSKGAKKSSSRKAASKGKSSGSRAANTGSMIPYGPPIREAIARGDAREMQQIATSARKWVRDVQTALDALERKIEKLSAR